jgi:hypothetical protein
MANKDIQELYRQEVLELTELLNNDWADLRDLFIENKIDLNGAYLAAYLEDEEDGSEHGVLLTADKKILRFVVDDGNMILTPIQKQEDILDEFPQVTAALAL